MSNEFIRQNSERFAKMFESALEDNSSKSDKQVSTEYTGVYTGIFPNIPPREIELETRVKELEENIKTIFSALIIANHKDIGAIQDTIWVNTYTTLWDYIRIVLNMDDKQFEEFKKQALQKIEEVK